MMVNKFKTTITIFTVMVQKIVGGFALTKIITDENKKQMCL